MSRTPRYLYCAHRLSWVRSIIFVLLVTSMVDFATAIHPLQAADEATALGYVRREQVLWIESEDFGDFTDLHHFPDHGDDGTEEDDDDVNDSHATVYKSNLFESIFLFVISFILPCARTANLWYAGGGRICFAYNERGRIVGLRYVPPIPNWFSARATEAVGADDNTKEARFLTEEQVMALPQIIYQPDPNRPTREDTSVAVVVDIALFPEKEEEGESPSGKLTVPSYDDDEEGRKDNCDAAANDDNDDDDDVQVTRWWQRFLFWRQHRPPQQSPHLHPEASKIKSNVMTQISTTCEMCSICITDFEPGEHLCLLPHCQHAFHTECILPWLTERQGSCPLCKISVLQQPQQPLSSQDDVGGNNADAHAELAMPSSSSP